MPRLLADALWAVAGGGQEPELRPLNPIGVFRTVTCSEEAQHLEDPEERDDRQAECRKHLPGMGLMEHLANQHVRDQNIERNSFRGGSASFSVMIRLSGTWTKEQFLRTVAERAQFGGGWRGAGAAARGLFGRGPDTLTLPQAALVASRAGVANGNDPWCDPVAASRARHRVLNGMLANGVISPADFTAAAGAPLALAAPPLDHLPCVGAP